VRRCYQKLISKKPDLAGTVTLRLGLEPVPESWPVVAAPSVVRSTIEEVSVERACAHQGLYRWPIPPMVFPESTPPREVEWTFRIGGALAPQPED
jgi:hypothetical protein